MIEWHELPSKRGEFYTGELHGPLDEALPRALRAILAKLSEYAGATHGEVTVLLEVGVDTGRIIAAVTTDRGEAGRRDGCAVRLQSLQDVWYDTEETIPDDPGFSEVIDNVCQRIGNEFLTLLQREGRNCLPDASTLCLVVFGGEPGEIMDESEVF